MSSMETSAVRLPPARVPETTPAPLPTDQRGRPDVDTLGAEIATLARTDPAASTARLDQAIATFTPVQQGELLRSIDTAARSSSPLTHVAPPNPNVREQVDAILPPGTTGAERAEAYRLAEAEIARLGGVGDSGVNRWAVPGAVADVLQANGIAFVASPEVIAAVDAGLARDATAAQRQQAYAAVQAEVDARGGVDSAALPGVVMTVLGREQLPVDANFAAQQGRSDAAELQALVDKSIEGELSEADLQRLEELQGSLKANENNPAYTAAFYNALGPEGAASLPQDLAHIAHNHDYASDGELDIDYEAFGRSLSVALGAASRSGALTDGFAQALREQSAPTTESIYLSTGTFDPEFVAELSLDVMLHHDPSLAAEDQWFEIEGASSPEYGGTLFGFQGINGDQTSFGVALGAIERSGAENEVLAQDGVAERLLDPDFEVESGHPSLDAVRDGVTALLDTPRQTLAADPDDPAAIAAGVNIVEAAITHKGDVSDLAVDAVLGLYTDHAGAILNYGEDAAAWNADTPFARALAEQPGANSGSAHFVVSAAMGPENAENGEARREAVVLATAEYRNEVALAGPGENPDAWGRELGEIDTDLVQGVGRRSILEGHEEDQRNGQIRWAIDKLTDYAGKIPLGQPVTGWVARGVNLAEDLGLDAILPIDNAANARDGIPVEIQSQIIGTQYTVLDGAIRSGTATDVPPELLADPNDPSQGLRVPDPNDPQDVADFQQAVQEYVAGLPADDPTRIAIAEATKVLETAYSDFDLAILPE